MDEFDTGIPNPDYLEEDDEHFYDDHETVVGAMIEESINWYEEHVEPEQAEATDYYKGEPFGDEVEGRSQVVVTSVRDTIRMIMPSLMRFFFGGPRVWSFTPTGPEDEEAAEQATDYVEYVIQRQSRGFMQLWSAFLDALTRKVGPVKWFVEMGEPVLVSSHDGITADEALYLIDQADPDVNPSIEEHEDGTVSLTLEREGEDRIMFQAFPPEELLHSPDARSVDDARLVGHAREMMASDLVEMGMDYQIVKRGKGKSESSSDDLESSRRIDQGSRSEHEEQQDDATRPVHVAEVYVRMRTDMSEDTAPVAIHKCFMVSGGGKWMLGAYEDGERMIEVVDEIPITCFGPSPEPHTWEGLSVADLVKDIQRIASQVWRGMLDSLASHLDPAMEAVEGEVNLQDLLNQERGRIIRSRKPGMLREITTEFVGASALPVLKELDDMRAMRSGLTRQSAGLDAASMQSTTKAAVVATQTQAQQQIELIVRIFAETAMTDLARGLLRLIVKNQDRPRMVRLRGKWVQIDPSHWNADMDVTVDFGLGTGGPEERLQFMAGQIEKMEAHLQMGSPLTDPLKLRNAYEAMFEAMGRRDTGKFWANPQELQQKMAAAAQQPPKPSNEEMLVKVEMAKIQQKEKADQRDAQIEFAKLQLEAAKLQQNARSDEVNAALKSAEMALKRESAEVDTVLKAASP
jgi:hypothetical protein